MTTDTERAQVGEGAAGVKGPEPLSDERILHLWDSYVNYETGKRSAQGMPLTDDDKLQFARAVLAAAGVAPSDGGQP